MHSLQKMNCGSFQILKEKQKTAWTDNHIMGCFTFNGTAELYQVSRTDIDQIATENNRVTSKYQKPDKTSLDFVSRNRLVRNVLQMILTIVLTKQFYRYQKTKTTEPN